MLKKLLYVLTLCMGVFTTSLVSAQETTADIHGTITSGKGTLADAVITAIHQPTGSKYVTTSRKDGRYNIPNVRVGGPYVILVSFVGYREEKQENISLSLGQDFKADFSLVTASASLGDLVVKSVRQDKLFNNSHTGSQEIISRDQIEKLPTINRAITDFTKLEPTSNGLSFGGRSSQYDNITVNGANFNNGFGLSPTLGGQTGQQPISIDAIDQIQVNVSPYDVKQGGFTSAGVNSVLKSGTNTFKGSVYTYLKGPGTQGYNVDNTTISRSPFNFYIRGASLGGPIIKNKLFFFANYEELNQTAPAFSVAASTPSNAPAAGSVSQIDTGSLGTLSRTLQNQFGYNPGSYQGYSNATTSKKLSAKIDWTIDSKSTLSFTYLYFRSQAQTNQSTSRAGAGFVKGPASQNYTYGLPFSASEYYINNNFDIYLLELNTRFNNKWSNKFQVGYTKERDPRAPGSSSLMPAVDILNGVGNTYGTQVATSFGYETYTYNNLINTDVYQLSDIVTLFTGKHEFTFGTQNYDRKYADAFAPSYAGGYQFPSFQAFYNAINGGPVVDKYYQSWSNIPGGAFPFYYAGSTEIGLFAQDKWRPTRNFTLTYGLRYDMTIYKAVFLDNPFFDALSFNGASYNIGKAPSNAVILSPRVGFNWDPIGDKSVQIRGGAGLFSGPPPFVWLANQGGNNGVLSASNNYVNVPFTTNAIANPPAGVVTTAPSTVQSATSYGAAVTAPNFKYPTVLKTSLAVDKKFADDWIVTAEASYSKDIDAVYYSNLNLNESNGFSLAGADNRIRYLVAGNNNSNKIYYGAGGATQANPNLSSAILMSNNSQGYAYTLTAKVQKNYRNLNLTAAYVYSSAKNIATGGSTASSLWSGRPVGNADPNGANLGYADYYQPHRIIASAMYAVASGKHFKTTIGAIFEAAPAGVGSYTYGGDLNGDGNSGNDLIYIPKNASEINLVKAGSGGLGTGASTDPRTVSQIWNQLNNFINQDHYLSFHRGQVVQANAVVLPDFKHLDINITQDIYFTTKNKNESSVHTLRLTMDLINAGNFLNRNWGLAKQFTTTSPLTFEGMAADGKTPSFSFPYIDATNQVPLVNSFSNNTSIFSRWQMQFGIKYMFN